MLRNCQPLVFKAKAVISASQVINYKAQADYDHFAFFSWRSLSHAVKIMLQIVLERFRVQFVTSFVRQATSPILTGLRVDWRKT
jgi:hypothetical protein